MRRDLKYGFTLAVLENVKTIPTLWNTTLKFMAENTELVAPQNFLEYVTDAHVGEIHTVLNIGSRLSVLNVRTTSGATLR